MFQCVAHGSVRTAASDSHADYGSHQGLLKLLLLSGFYTSFQADPLLATTLGVFPRVHPFQRQVCWSNIDPAMLPSVDDIVSGAELANKRFLNQTVQAIRSAGASNAWLERNKIFDVTLHPGDTLFLPPFWFHAVFAVDNSVSISRSLRSYEVLDDIPTIGAACVAQCCLDRLGRTPDHTR